MVALRRSYWNEVVGRNQSIRNQVINSMLAEQDVRLAKSVMYPVLSFNAGITESENQFSAGELSARGATLNYFGNFTLNFNLFNVVSTFLHFPSIHLFFDSSFIHFLILGSFNLSYFIYSTSDV